MVDPMQQDLKAPAMAGRTLGASPCKHPHTLWHGMPQAASSHICCSCCVPWIPLVKASEGGGLFINSPTQADLRNNKVAHNTALKQGGGLECSTNYGGKRVLASTNNTWLNNTANGRGGGVITNPCDMTLHGDKILGNRAKQEGGGFMVYGGTKVQAQNVQVSCNSAQAGAGVAVKLSDKGEPSTLFLTCSKVTANGVVYYVEAQQTCLHIVTTAGSTGADAEAFLTAAAAAASSQRSNHSAAHTERGGGILIAAGQKVVLTASVVGGNLASSSGAGVHVESKGYLKVTGAEDGSAPAVVSFNACPGGAGGGIFLNTGSELSAYGASLTNNSVSWCPVRHPAFCGTPHCMDAAKYPCMECELAAVRVNVYVMLPKRQRARQSPGHICPLPELILEGPPLAQTLTHSLTHSPLLTLFTADMLHVG